MNGIVTRMNLSCCFLYPFSPYYPPCTTLFPIRTATKPPQPSFNTAAFLFSPWNHHDFFEFKDHSTNTSRFDLGDIKSQCRESITDKRWYSLSERLLRCLTNQSSKNGNSTTYPVIHENPKRKICENVYGYILPWTGIHEWVMFIILDTSHLPADWLLYL